MDFGSGLVWWLMPPIISPQHSVLEYLIYLLPALGLAGLAYRTILASWVSKQDAGDAKMTGIAEHIAEGAMAFLKAEYRII